MTVVRECGLQRLLEHVVDRDDAERALLVVDHGDRDEVVAGEQLGDVLDRRVGGHRGRLDRVC